MFGIVEMEKRVSLASIRAEGLTENLARLLEKGGLRTLTLAADGLSERLRKQIHKKVTAGDLVNAASIASSVGIKGMKLYVMVGLPGESDDDIAEFCELTLKLSGILRVSIAAQAFVPKPGTPLAPASALWRRTCRPDSASLCSTSWKPIWLTG